MILMTFILISLYFLKFLISNIMRYLLLKFRKLIITLFLIFSYNSGYSQDFSTIKSINYNQAKKSFEIKIANKIIYQQLKGWNDQAISEKYTSVLGIKVFRLNRQIENEIYSEITKENILYILKNYISFSDKDINTIINSL